jgi:hypothetical protein
MINDKNKKQEGAENSTNIQAEVVNVNNGITYSDAKEIAMDVFKSNAIILSREATEIALKRVEEFSDKFLTQLENLHPKAIINLRNPNIQIALFNSQNDFAKTGDNHLLDLLVDMLVELIIEEERNLKSIVLEESLKTASKLTPAQLDILSLLFFSLESIDEDVQDIESFDYFLNNSIKPFTENIPLNKFSYDHLIYTGCCFQRTGIGSRLGMMNCFIRSYKGLFQKGKSKEEFMNILNNSELFYEKLIIPCYLDKSKVQLKFISNNDLENECDKMNFDKKKIDTLTKIYNESSIGYKDVLSCLSKNHIWIEEANHNWNRCVIGAMSLTGVGIAIAQANIKRKLGNMIDLSIWTKE